MKRKVSLARGGTLPILATVLSTIGVSVLLADAFFTEAAIQELQRMASANACRLGCTFSGLPGWDPNDEVRLERLVANLGEGITGYFATKVKGPCGSAGCESGVFLLEGDRMEKIDEEFGVTVERAERIARSFVEDRQRRADAAAASMSLRSDSIESTRNHALAAGALCVATLCIVSGVVTRKVAHGLNVWQRIGIQTLTAILSSSALYFLGIVGEISLVSIPLAAGVSVSIVASIKDILG